MSNPKLTIISLGWGVQSWLLAAMSALGKLPPVDFAIHSDTTWEREGTYDFAVQMTPWLEERDVRVVTVRDNTIPEFAVANEWGGVFVPAYTIGNGSANGGQLRRQCTQRWKISPMRRFIAAELNRRGLSKTPGVVAQWLGITVDEIQRARDSDVKYIAHRFPLLELEYTRADCYAWLKDNNLPIPPKSACVFCPYQNKRRWQEMKRSNGADWQTALSVDEAIRDKRPPHALFVHPDRIPLYEAVDIPEDHGATQLNLFDDGIDDSNAECDSGYCFL